MFIGIVFFLFFNILAQKQSVVSRELLESDQRLIYSDFVSTYGFRLKIPILTILLIGISIIWILPKNSTLVLAGAVFLSGCALIIPHRIVWRKTKTMALPDTFFFLKKRQFIFEYLSFFTFAAGIVITELFF